MSERSLGGNDCGMVGKMTDNVGTLSYKSHMQIASKSAPVSVSWKLTILAPLAVALALELFSHRASDVRAGVQLSIAGNMCLAFSLVAQSLFLMKRTTTWGILLLIMSVVLMGFGLHVLVKAFR